MASGIVVASDAINDDDIRNATRRLGQHRPAVRATGRFCGRCGLPWPCVTVKGAIHLVAAARAAGLIGAHTGGGAR